MTEKRKSRSRSKVKGLLLNLYQNDFLRSLFHRVMFTKDCPAAQNALVGVWRPDFNPTQLAKAVAMMAPSQGIDVVYFRPHCVDTKREQAYGMRLKPGTDQWERVTMRIPDIVDVSSFCWEDKEARVYLEERCWCTDMKKNRISKGRLQTMLAKDPAVKKYAIPTLRFIKKGQGQDEKLERLMEFARKHDDVVAKPVHSQRGTGVHRITFDVATGHFHVGFKTAEMDMDEERFRVYAKESFFSGKAHIVQKYVSSRSKAGDPFDCRVHVEKNGQGKWEPASMLVRIGIGQKIISNINQGGGVAELEPFLRANRPDNWEEIIERLSELASTVPYWYEKKRGVELCTLGIDTAITPEGNLHIFEVNSLPFTDFNLGQVAMLRVAYYRWLMENRIGE